MSVQSVAAVFFLFFLSLGNGGDSKELDILWEKYGDLRAEVEELKALHRKEQDESSSEEETEDEKQGECVEEEETEDKSNNENRGYTKFPVKFRNLRIFPTESDYKGCAIQIEAPMNARFECYADNRPFLATSKPTKKPPKPIPNARYKMVDGLHQVICFSREEMCYLFVFVDPILSANVLIHTGNPESNLTISKEIFSPEMGFRLYDQTQNDSYQEAKVDFEFKNVDALGGGHIEYHGELMWNNGSRLEIEWANSGLVKNVNLTLTEKPLSKSETEVKLAVPTIQAKELRGLSHISLKYIAETMEMGQYIALQYWILLEGKKSLLEPFRETDISFFTDKEIIVFEGKNGYLTCGAFANPKATIEIFKENGNRREKVKNTEKVVLSADSVMAIKTWEDVSTDNEGKYICRGTSGDNEQEVPVNVVVIPVVLIVGSSVKKAFNIVSVNVQFLARGTRNIVAHCNAGSRNGEVIFREYSDYGLNRYYTYNDTMDIWNSSWASNAERDVNQTFIASSLEEYSPLVIDYSSNTEVTVQNQTLKNVTVTLDLEISPEPPTQLACMAFIEGELFSPPSEWTTIHID